MMYLKILIALVLIVVHSIVALATVLIRYPKGYFAVGTRWAKQTLWLFGVGLKVVGSENVARGSSYIYASNHASGFDILAVLAGIPDQVRFILKKELGKIPIFGWALRYGPYITIDRSNASKAMRSLEKAADIIRNGGSVIVFPEGTRTRDGRLQAFKRGTFSLALKSGVPVIPVGIRNSFEIMAKGSLKIQPRDITMVLGTPIPVNGLSGREGELKLMEIVRARIEECLTKPVE